jgi:diguanylate cyclase (GGDEF)-like protein
MSGAEMIGKSGDALNDKSPQSGLLSWQTFYRFILTPPAIVVGAVIVASVMVILCSVVLYQTRLDALARTRDATRNVALMAEKDIERNFEIFSLALQGVVDGVNDPEVMAASDKLRRHVLFDRATTASYLGSTLVIDAKGNLVFDSASEVPRKINYADRKYFPIHRGHPNVGLHVSGPYRSRLRDGSQIVVLSRRISRPDGSFGGVAVFSIDLEYFRKLFSAMELGQHGAATLMSTDGIIVMRQPYDVHLIGRDISHSGIFAKLVAKPEGAFLGVCIFDNVQRFYYVKRLPNLPLIIIVAEGEDDIYASWRTRAAIIGSLMVAFAVGLVGLSVILAVQLRRRMRAESELVLLARTDGLTGLNNRRTLGDVLDKEWRKAKRTHSVLSLLFVDVDRFKAYNDTYGHQAGDDALAAVAKCIGENICRPGDSAARYGGEEFVVVLPDTTAAGATAIAEKIRTAISDLAIEHAGSEFGRVTASIGAVSTIPEGDSDATTVIRAADEALYYAKARGRNKVASSSLVAA